MQRYVPSFAREAFRHVFRRKIEKWVLSRLPSRKIIFPRLDRTRVGTRVPTGVCRMPSKPNINVITDDKREIYGYIRVESDTYENDEFSLESDSETKHTRKI